MINKHPSSISRARRKAGAPPLRKQNISDEDLALIDNIASLLAATPRPPGIANPISVSAISRATGISRGDINSYLAGHATPRPARLLKLREWLETVI